MEGPGSLRPSRSIQEFRIDFLLEEEFAVDFDFVQAFIAACGANFVPERVERVVHSLNDLHGEADLAVLLAGRGLNAEPGTIALLIEDKINAGLQPSQAERYRRRGEHGAQSGQWDAFLTVLVAPHAYIPEQHGFDAAISLEQIRGWICASDPLRRAFKIQKIDEAIQKKNATGVQIVDANMTAFRTAYYHLVQDFNIQRGTDFIMRAPAPTYYGDIWVLWKSRKLPSWAEFRHMMTTGNIELSFKDTDFDRSLALRDFLHQHQIELLATGKYKQHVTFRLGAPKITEFDDFAREQPKVEAALKNAEVLWHLMQHERERFDEILIPARRK